MSEYKVETVYFADDKFILKAPDGRVLSMVYPDRKPLDYATSVLNSETAKLQAELDAAKAEITRLREGIHMAIVYLASDDVSFNFSVGAAVSELSECLDPSRDLSTGTTDVTLNDDTQELPVLEQLSFDGSPEKTAPKFKVGDKVRYLFPTSNSHEQLEGKVSSVVNGGLGISWVWVVWGNYSDEFIYVPTELEHAD